MTASDVLLILAAPAIGSFLGLVITRLPEGRPVLVGRSRCDHCGRALGLRDLIPLLSWVWLRGRCRRCAAPIGNLAPAIELAALGVAGWAATETTGAALACSCGLGWALLVLGWLDARHLWLPDVVTLPLLGAGLAATAWLDPASLRTHALGAALGWAGFAAVAATYRRWRGQDGLGGGDAKLLGVAGAWLGAPALPPVVLIAAIAGLLAAVARPRERAGAPVAFGIWLAVSIWLVWLYGPPG